MTAVYHRELGIFLAYSHLEKEREEGDGAQKGKLQRHLHKGLVVLPRQLQMFYKESSRFIGNLVIYECQELLILTRQSTVLLIVTCWGIPCLANTSTHSIHALVTVFQFGKREIYCVQQHAILPSSGKRWYLERADSTYSLVNIYNKKMSWSFGWPLKKEAKFVWAGHFKGF